MKHRVQLLYQQRARAGWSYVCEAVDDLQPLLDVELQIQRSEYCANRVLVENLVRAVT